MKMSDRGRAELAGHEGIVPGPYLDSVGVWTFGVGHTANAGAPDPRAMPRGMPQDIDAGPYQPGDHVGRFAGRTYGSYNFCASLYFWVHFDSGLFAGLPVLLLGLG